MGRAFGSFSNFQASTPSPNPRPEGFDVYDFLHDFTENIEDSMANIRFYQMLASPFIFYRGTADLWFLDWTNNTALETYGSYRTLVWIMGDCHIQNFGTFQNSDGYLVYELNDFDQAAVGPYQLDVWRLATSLVLVAEELKMNNQVASWINVFARSYAQTVQSFKGSNSKSSLTTQFGIKETRGELKSFLEKVNKKNSRIKMLNSYTVVENNQRRFKNSSNLQPVNQNTSLDIAENFRFYVLSITGALRNPFTRPNGDNFFYIKDCAARLGAGTGSLGMARYYALIEGPSSSLDDDLILDIKQGDRPILRYYLEGDALIQYEVWFKGWVAEGDRHDIAYHALSTKTDPLLGHMFLPASDAVDGIKNHQVFFVRERSPWKETWSYTPTASTIKEMCQNWGKILATQHSRSDVKFRDGRFVYTSFPDNFAAVIKGKNEEFVAQVQAVALAYAQVVNSDFLQFKARVLNVSGINSTTTLVQAFDKNEVDFDENEGALLNSGTTPPAKKIMIAVFIIMVALAGIMSVLLLMWKRYSVGWESQYACISPVAMVPSTIPRKEGEEHI